jgi:hypothetical protein
MLSAAKLWREQELERREPMSQLFWRVPRGSPSLVIKPRQSSNPFPSRKRGMFFRFAILAFSIDFARKNEGCRLLDRLLTEIPLVRSIPFRR